MSIRQGGPARRAATTSVAVLLAAGSLVAATGQPAVAILDYVTPTSVAWTDASAADQVLLAIRRQRAGGHLGGQRSQAHRPGVLHLRPDALSGQRVVSARAITGETKVNDCDKPREIELWRTDPPASAPTWNTAPTAREKVADVAYPNLPCGSSFIG